jgi:hypothetical protein
VPREDDQHAARRREEERAAARARVEQQHTWVDLQLRRAQERGDFADLPGLGKPLEGLGEEHDPDWWVKRLVEREKIAVLPPALQLRRDDAALDQVLDGLASEAEVRREVMDFNERVRRTLYTTSGWPPVVTSPRDVEEEVSRWRQRLAARRAAHRTQREPEPSRERDDPTASRGRWRRRRRG